MKTPTSARSYVVRTLSVAAIIVLVAYTFFAFRHLIEGPLIAINYPPSGIEVSAPIIEIRGLIKNASHVNLNDRKVFTDPEGNLQEPLLLSNGTNVIRLSAEDRFGRKVTEELVVTLTPHTSSTATHLIPPAL